MSCDFWDSPIHGPPTRDKFGIIGVQYLTYKAEYAGRKVMLVDPHGTSQRCSGCGTVVKKSLSVRDHSCPRCGLEINRDINAAKNILTLGLQSLGIVPRSHPVHGVE